MAASLPPAIPPEIWATVLRSYGSDADDLTHLWKQCRQVSKQFKAEVEKIFVKRHLPKVKVCFQNIDTRRLPFLEALYFKVRTNLLGKTEYAGLSDDCEIALFNALATEQEDDQDKADQTKHTRIFFILFNPFTSFERKSRFVSSPNGKLVFETNWKSLFDEIMA